MSVLCLAASFVQDKWIHSRFLCKGTVGVFCDARTVALTALSCLSADTNTLSSLSSVSNLCFAVTMSFCTVTGASTLLKHSTSDSGGCGFS